jgi:rRNA biogenesis protein RRP5
LSDNKKQDVSKALKGFRAGDQVKAVIISIDREKRQVNFSIKASLFSDKVVNEDDDEEMAEDVDDAEAGSDDEDDEDEDADEDQLEGLDIEGKEEDEDDVEEEDEEEDEAAEDDSEDDEVKVSYIAYAQSKLTPHS